MKYYNKIVLDDKDIVGKMALAHYYNALKARERQYESENGKSPNKKQIIDFQDTLSSEENIKLYKEHSAKILADFTTLTIHDHCKGQEDKSFWSGVLQSLMATAIWTFIVVLILILYNPDVIDYVKQLSGQNNPVEGTLNSEFPEYKQNEIKGE